MIVDFKNSEIDLLIFYYLQECGYIHSAFNLNYESNLNFKEIKNKNIPPGLLISLFQRGLIYSQIEMNSSLSFRDNLKSPIENFFIDKNNIINRSFFVNEKIYLKEKLNLFCYDYSIYNVIWHPRRLVIFFGTRDFKIFQWTLKFGKLKKKPKNISASISIKEPFPERLDVAALDFNLTGTIAVSGLLNGYVFLWTENGKFLKSFRIPEESIFDIKWNENSRNILIGNIFGNIYLWSTWFTQFLLKISLFNSPIVCLKWLNKKDIVTCSLKQIIGFLQTNTKILKTSKTHFSRINMISWISNKSILTLCSNDKLISLWTLKKSLFFINFLVGHEKEVTAITAKPRKIFKNKNKKKKIIIISCSLDFCLKLWDIKKGRCLMNFYQEGPILSLAWNGNGSEFFIGMVKGEIILINKKCMIIKRIFLKNYDIYYLNSHPMAKNRGGLSIKSIFLL